MKDLKTRTKQFAIDCWLLCDKFPNSRGFNAYVNQLIRCSSSVGANYRASQRAKSIADFINKLKTVSKEYHEEIKVLHSEANEILSIIVSSINKARNRTK